MTKTLYEKLETASSQLKEILEKHGERLEKIEEELGEDRVEEIKGNLEDIWHAVGEVYSDLF